MFYGLASGSVDTGGIEGRPECSPTSQTLNRAAFDGKYEVTAVSFHAYAHLADKYALLPHGASMGDNYGPIVVARRERRRRGEGRTIAIPGTLTTAYLALRLYEPDFEYVVVPFDRSRSSCCRARRTPGC
jgi:1,4-dihydroxy-6-naphthoate synthase